ncbi:MAG: ABC transporter permease [Phycisphaerales bacterium]|jgi:oligopeptide transport system permease protein|nr:ABC transporter permease [Phycisphaerales bacterium]
MTPMRRMVLSRLAQVPLILLAVYTLTFALAWLIPGNPLQRDEGRRPPAAIAEAMQAQWNLDDPWTFYWSYLGDVSGVSWLLGDRTGAVLEFGPSLRHENWTVGEIISGQLPVSMTLGLAAMVLAVVGGVTLGTLGGLRPDTWVDRLTGSVAVIGVSIPAFVIGTALLMAGGVWLEWFPIGGWGSWRHLLLPAVALSLPFAAWIARLTRQGVIEEMRADYVRTARAKGLPEHTVVTRHVLPNALLPVLSYLGPATAAALTGSFVIEKVFAIPGLGMHFVDAVLGKDLTMIMGIVLVYSTMLVLLNLAVDVLYAWVDPRITVGAAS